MDYDHEIKLHRRRMLAAFAAIMLDQMEAKKRRQQKKLLQRRRRAKTRHYWVQPFLTGRKIFGQYDHLVQELAADSPECYKNYMRMDYDLSCEVLDRIGHHITKEDTYMRDAIPSGLRLAMTLRYLATGDSYKSLHYNFLVGHSTVGRIILNTCEAIIAEYQEEVMSCPSSPEEWLEVADGYATRWNFQNCLGALDGKHVALKCPPGSGSEYYNYKGFFSIVLMALVDAHYKFLYVNLGANGNCSDGGVFRDCNLREALEGEYAGLPPPQALKDDRTPLPFAIVGDDAFPLREWLMKPFPHRLMSRPERIFNYRLSRARRVVENVFGILAHR